MVYHNLAVHLFFKKSQSNAIALMVWLV